MEVRWKVSGDSRSVLSGVVVRVLNLARGRRLSYCARCLVITGLVVASFGCNSAEEKRRTEAVLQARFAGELQLARTNVVEKAYEEGRLGTPERVLVEVEQYVQEAIGAGAEEDPRFLTAHGKLVPFTQQSESQRLAFLSWITGREVIAVLGPEMVAARDEVRKKWDEREGNQ